MKDSREPEEEERGDKEAEVQVTPPPNAFTAATIPTDTMDMITCEVIGGDSNSRVGSTAIEEGKAVVEESIHRIVHSESNSGSLKDHSDGVNGNDDVKGTRGEQ